MANSLNLELENKWVILKSYFIDESLNGAKFLCEGGFGCNKSTNGTMIVGKLEDGRKITITGYDINRLCKKNEIPSS